MLGGMEDEDPLIWLFLKPQPSKVRLRMLRALKRQCLQDLTDAEAQVAALRHRLLLIDNAVSDYMLGGKHGGRAND